MPFRLSSPPLSVNNAPLPADRYEVADLTTDIIGQGGMGLVYRGVDRETSEAIVIKALRPDVISHRAAALRRFQREGEALRQLNHPNIVKLLAMVEEANHYYLVMEYVPGGSLRDLLETASPARLLSTKRVIQIGLELSDALARAHHLNIIHRDLKPANVLLAADDTPRLTDFGAAHLAQAERLTGSGALVGTLDYLAPEVLNGEAVDVRGDIWSLGVLLFEMLTLQRPFAGATMTEVLTTILTRPVPDLAQLRPDTPPPLIELIGQMLNKDPRQRIRRMRQVGAELEAILD
jgi:serine/threonine protein kinase